MVWDAETTIELGALPGGTMAAPRDINNFGHVVGSADTATGAHHAFLWDDGTIIDLGTLGGDRSVAFAINDHRHIVGTSRTASGAEHAFLWRDGVMIDLGTLPGGAFSSAHGINTRGQIAGSSGTASGETHAVVWTAPLVPTSKDECKNGGYKRFGPPAGPFRNQGECVAYVESNAKWKR